MLWVMLVDEKPERSSQLGHALADAGYDVVATLTGRDDLRAQIVALAPDVIIVDMQSPSRDLLEDMRRIHEERPRPIVMFVDEDLGGHQILAFAAQPTSCVFEVDDAYRSLHDVTYEGAEWTV